MSLKKQRNSRKRKLRRLKKHRRMLWQNPLKKTQIKVRIKKRRHRFLEKNQKRYLQKISQQRLLRQ